MTVQKQTPRSYRVSRRLLPWALVWAVLGSMPGASVASPDAFEQVDRLGRGVNIIGYDPIWRDRKAARFQERHFRIIRDGGFQSVRVNLHGLQHVENGRVDPAWLETLDWVVASALEADLMVILDLHNFTDFAEDPEGLHPKFLAFWRQVAVHYRDAPDRVLFEILNEPNGRLTPELWNRYLAEALAIIREHDPDRTVIVGPAFWYKISHLEALELPEDDRNLIVSIHYYDPMRFTHQGAPWMDDYVGLSGVIWGSEDDRRRVEEDFTRAQDWAKDQRRPIFLGEFGAYDVGDMESRVRYTSHVARTAEFLGWAWAYWQFDSDFVVYDLDADRWVEPIWRALVPESAVSSGEREGSRPNP